MSTEMRFYISIQVTRNVWKENNMKLCDIRYVSHFLLKEARNIK